MADAKRERSRSKAKEGTCSPILALNVGFVGCGGFVHGNHLPNTAANPLLHIHALCDLDGRNLDALAAKYSPHMSRRMSKEIAPMRKLT